MSNIGRREFVELMGLGGIGLSMSCSAGKNPLRKTTEGEMKTDQRPNIVVMLADDLGWNDVGYHGSEIPTPNIDGFVQEGIALERFYACPVCSPTRAGLLTGRYPHRFGLRDTVIPPWRDFGLSTAEVCLPEYLSTVGYERRACLGKWHLGHSELKYHPINRGFTHFYGHYNGAIDYFTHKREGEMDWHRNFDSCYDEGYSTDLLADEAVRFIEKSPEDNPFLLYVAFNAPHSPLQAKEEDLVRFGYDKNKPTFGESEKDFGAEGKGNTKRQTYSAMVWSMDEGIGRILKALDRKGISENTIVLFFSDNGGASLAFGADNEPLRGRKHTVWEGGVRVPAAIRWPERLKGGRKFNGMMGYIDMLPTFISAAGVRQTPKNELDGMDVLPVLSGEQDLPNREFYLGQESLVTQQWKLIEGQLFNIEKDPNEVENIAEQHPEILTRLNNRLKEFEALESDIKVAPFGEGRKGFIAPPEWKIK